MPHEARIYDPVATERGLLDLYQGITPLRYGTREAQEFLDDPTKFTLFENNSVLVINKPAGLPSHSPDHTFKVGIEEICRYVLDRPQLNLVHRLDRDTSGALILAKTPTAFVDLQEQFTQKTKVGLARYRRPNIYHKKVDLEKMYVAVLDGELTTPLSIYADLEETHRSVVVAHRESQNGNPRCHSSLTHFIPHRTIESAAGKHTIAAIQIVTGRRHQIRAVAQMIRHPVTGDTDYGSNHNIVNRQMLHARYISFRDPESPQIITVEAPFPEDMMGFINASASANSSIQAAV